MDANCNTEINRMDSYKKRKVAVIGAGAGGLAAAKELQKEGHSVIIYEQSHVVGGTWNYEPIPETDPLGFDPHRKIVHSSMYKSLRTNLPREIMGFVEYPFKYHPQGDPRRFPGHQEVLKYLQSFANHFGLMGLIRFGTGVVRVWRYGNSQGHSGVETLQQNGIGEHKDRDGGEWIVKSRREMDGSEEEESFDAVVVCNGHYSQPRILPIPGIKTWPGKQLHSHNYRVPEPFHNQVVIVIGNSASGVDISQELAKFAKEVHLSARSIKNDDTNKNKKFGEVILHPMVESLFDDGSVMFQDGRTIIADVIIHCTGYCYQFPFLETEGIISVEDNYVKPLYEHVFPPLLAPSLSFVGLPWRVLPFILFELQSRWISQSLSGKAPLPSQSEMVKAVDNFYSEFEASGQSKYYIHYLAQNQFDYDNWLSDQSGSPNVEQWRKEIYREASENKKTRPESYRDEWDDHHWLEVAQSDLSNSNYYYFGIFRCYLLACSGLEDRPTLGDSAFTILGAFNSFEPQHLLIWLSHSIYWTTQRLPTFMDHTHD